MEAYRAYLCNPNIHSLTIGCVAKRNADIPPIHLKQEYIILFNDCINLTTGNIATVISPKVNSHVY